MDAGPGAAEERSPPRLRVLASEQRERPVVMPFRPEPRFHGLVALGGAHQRVDCLGADVGGNTVDRAELFDELRGGGEVMSYLVAARCEHRCDERVPAGPFRLGERAVGDLANELRLEMELVVIDEEEVAFGKIVEHSARVGPCGQGEDGRDRAAATDDRAVFQQ